jgi:type IV secretory pathway VirB2 component (pilin)
MSLEIKPKKAKRVGLVLSKLGAILSFGGILFAFAPVAIAFLSTPPGGNPFSEGGGGGGAALWLMILTLPLGAIASIIGLVLMFVGIIYSLKTKTPVDSDNPGLRSKVLKEKSISLALLVPTLMITSPVICFVIGSMIVGPTAGTVAVITSAALAVAATGIALMFAFLSKLPKLQLVLSILAVIFLVGVYFEAQLLYSFFADQITPTYK